MIGLAPLLNVRGGIDAIAFYMHAFGVEKLFLLKDEIGHVVATLGIGALEFWVAVKAPHHPNPAPLMLDGSSALMI